MELIRQSYYEKGKRKTASFSINNAQVILKNKQEFSFLNKKLSDAFLKCVCKLIKIKKTL